MLDLTNIFKDIVLLPQEDDVDYNSLIKVIQSLAQDIHDNIDVFTDLIDVDKVPDIFLPKLMYLVKYNLNYNLDISVQREIVKRVIDIYRRRGTDDSIINAATYSSYSKWIGGHMFMPDYELSNEQATLLYPIDNLFKHNISNHSGTDKYSDGVFWRAGILSIGLFYLDDLVREAVKRVVPAGLRVYFNLISNSFGNDGNIIQYGEVSADSFYQLHVDLLQDPVSKISANFFSLLPRPGVDKLSGRRQLYDFYQVEVFTNLVLEEYNKQIDDGVAVLKFRGLPLRSTSKAIRSGMYSVSGIFTAVYDSFTSYNYRYFVSTFIENLNKIGYGIISSVTLDYQQDVEVLQTS